MKKSNELKQLRASKIDAQQNIVTSAETRAEGQRDLTADEATRFDALQTEIESLDVEIVRAEKYEANQAARAAKGGEAVSAPAIHRSTKNERFSIVDAVKSLATNKQLTGKAAEVNERAIAEMKAQGMEIQEGLRLHLPSDIVSRGQSVSDDSGAKGGALVASDPRYVAPLAPNTSVLTDLGVTELRDLVGDVPLPTNGLFTFGFVGETEAVSETDVNFAGPTLKPKRCSGAAGISNKWLRQTSQSVDNLIATEIRNGAGRAIISSVINGGGGNDITGLIDLITSNIDTTTGAPTRAIITNLEALIDAADATSVSRGYLSDTKLANALKNIKVDAGSGRFLYDGDMLNGYNYVKSTLVPELTGTPNKHPLIFGDWSQLFLGHWNNMSILVNPYSLARQAKIEMVVDTYVDASVTNEKAFAINKVLEI